MKSPFTAPRRWWHRRTLRARVTMVVTAVALIVFSTAGWLTAVAFGTAWLNQLDGELRTTLSTVANDVKTGKPPSEPGLNRTVRILDTSGRPLDNPALPVPLNDDQLRRLLEGAGTFDVNDVSRPEPVRWVGSVVSEPGGGQRLVVVGTGIGGYTAVATTAVRWAVAAGLAATFLVAATAWLAVRWSLRPVERMRAVANALPPGQRLPVPEARDELRALAEELNALLTRRDEAAERMRRFSGDAAHELRSPVASLLVQAEVAVAHPDPEHSQETLADIAVEAGRLSALVDDLLMLARADAVELPPAEPVDLVAVARSAAGQLGVPGIVMRVEAPTPVAVFAARREVELVVNNLLRNASRYARALVRVMVLPAGPMARLVVDDDGPGVPDEHRAQVFERFYRVDEARDRSSGGAGLGLALVADLVRRRGGSVRTGTSPEGGARFDIRWPTAH